jgi:hypothetical protein
MTDNGAAMLAAETRRGLAELGVIHELTLPYSPYQNAKQEIFWASVEGRLMAMLEGEPELTLSLLNRATQAWSELDYNQRVHRELKQTPVQRCTTARSVLRPSPGAKDLRQAFQRVETRRQRRSDGTVTVDGIRYQVPSRLGHLRTLTLRFAQWDKGQIACVDERDGNLLAALFPLDRQRNAEGHRGPRQGPLQGEPSPTIQVPRSRRASRHGCAR